MSESPDTADIELRLPSPLVDVLTASMTSFKDPATWGLSCPATYQYFEIDEWRFGWIADPSDLSGSAAGVFAAIVGHRVGDFYMALGLRKTGTAWALWKVLPYDSPGAARRVAATQWLARVDLLAPPTSSGKDHAPTHRDLGRSSRSRVRAE